MVTQNMADVREVDSASNPNISGKGTRDIREWTAVVVPPKPGTLPKDWALPTVMIARYEMERLVQTARWERE